MSLGVIATVTVTANCHRNRTDTLATFRFGSGAAKTGETERPRTRCCVAENVMLTVAITPNSPPALSPYIRSFCDISTNNKGVIAVVTVNRHRKSTVTVNRHRKALASMIMTSGF
jgi:hypothetical protein